MFNFSLTRRYIPAIVLLVIFIISAHIIINKIVSDNKELAKIINISGKQRMLSQRLIIIGQMYYENTLDKNELKKVLNEIKTAHKYLKTKIFNQRLQELYFGEDGLDKHLKEYLNQFENLMNHANLIFLKNARDNSTIILKHLDTIVKEYEKYANSRINETLKVEFYIMIITLLILVLEVIFIFRPAAKQIEKNTQNLILAKEYEETVIESNNNAIIAVDKTGTITTFNNKAVEIFGFSKEEMIGTKNLLKIVPKEYKELHQKAMMNYLKTGKSIGILGKSHELKGLKKDGTIFDIRISFGAKYKPDNIVVVANISDITEEKQKNALIIQQSKLASIGEMLGNIAHQWRQPLSVISTSISSIAIEKEYGMLDDKKFDERINIAIKNIESLSNTIDEFINFFKVSKEKETFLVSAMLLKIQHILDSSIKAHDITYIKA